ncbi:MAG: phosphatidylserine decarboxylase [candidate division WOR-3 bacterium]
MIAVEGFKVLVVSFFLTILFLLMRLYLISGVVFVFFLFSIFFFRDPSREKKFDTDEIVSPADGKILEIANEGGEVSISIFMSLTDVHVNRVPYGGKVRSIKRSGKKFLRAFLKEADFENVQCETVIESPSLGEYRVIQITGIIARRIVNNLKVGQEVKTGQRMGIILYGSKVKLILPSEKVEILVTPGQKVKAGITTIARVRI